MTKSLLVLLTLSFAAWLDAQTRIRIVAGNLTSGRAQSYTPGHGSRIFKGLRPDIALVQEFNTGDNSEAAVRRWVDEVFGRAFHYHREKSTRGEIPNGIVSRFPILEKGEWDDSAVRDREFVWARIDIPGNIDLYVVSVHLLTDDDRRPPESAQLAGSVLHRVPSKAYLVIGGDLNTDSMRDRAFDSLRRVVTIPRHLPSDGTGRTGTNRNRTKPYDHVLADSDLAPLETAVRIGDRMFRNGLVFDSRVFEPIDAVAPVQRGDSAAENMQHMAVVRDYLLPDKVLLHRARTKAREKPR